MESTLLQQFNQSTFDNIGSKCITPDGGVGICKSLDQCKYLLEQVDSFHTYSEDQRHNLQNELEQRKCGYDAAGWKVCCHDCVTPDKKSGIRKHIRDCPHLAKLFDEKSRIGLLYVKRSRIASGLDFCCGPVPVEQKSTMPASEKPVTTEQSSGAEEPVIFDKLPATEKPVATEQSPDTEKPVITEQLPTTEKPVATELLPGTVEPVIIDKLPATEKPVTTEQSPGTVEPLTIGKLPATEKPVDKYAGTRTADSKCTTPDGGLGLCKSIYKCKRALDIVDSYHTIVEEKRRECVKTKLRRSHCGYDGDAVKVCCSDCVNPDGKSGIRKKIRNCPHLADMLSEKSKQGLVYVTRSRLDSLEDVCCGPPRTMESPSTSRTGTAQLQVNNSCDTVLFTEPPDYEH